MRTLVFAVAAVLSVACFSGVGSADAFNTGANRPVTPLAGSETTLDTVFQTLMTDPFVTFGPGTDQDNNALWYPASPTSATIIIEIAGFEDDNILGIYSSFDNNQTVQLFNGADVAGDTVTLTFFGGFVSVNGGAAVAFDLSEGFGFYLTSPDGTFYTEDSRNTNGDAHSLVYQGEGGGQSIEIGGVDYLLTSTDWVIAWEDRNFEVSDRDYQDFVFLVQGLVATPEPGTLALLGLGAAVVGARAARRRRAKSAS